MSDTTIQINPTKSTELEFDVILSGVDATDVPIVRFVAVSAVDNCDFSFRCEKVDGEKNKWVVKLPSLTFIKVDSLHFRVECIIDSNYFEPATGDIVFVKTSEVKFNKKKAPSTVTTSFGVKQETTQPKKEEKPKAKKVKETVEEPGIEEPVDEGAGGGGGPTVTGRYAPTNALLHPEEDPIVNNRMRGDTSVNDEFTDTSRLKNVRKSDAASAVDPEQDELNKINDIADDHPLGDGKQYPQEDGKDGFDARDIANKIIKDNMGNVKAPAKKGSLFKRGADGKPIIAGLESNGTREEQARKAAKVKEILGTK